MPVAVGHLAGRSQVERAAVQNELLGSLFSHSHPVVGKPGVLGVSSALQLAPFPCFCVPSESFPFSFGITTSSIFLSSARLPASRDQRPSRVASGSFLTGSLAGFISTSIHLVI